MKRCSTCGELKELDGFNRLSKAKDGRQYSCRACNAAYHAAHKARHNAQIQARTRRIRRELQALLLAYLLEHPCTDCGEFDPVVLEFDHVGDKEANVSVLMTRRSWPAVLREIEKCEVVCANCHRRRTYRRQGSARSTWTSSEAATRRAAG